MDRKVIYLEDAIDALERKKDKKAKGDIGGFYNKIIQNDIDALMQLPSAQPERKTGEWILSDTQNPEDTRNGNYTYTCSNCSHSDIHAKTTVVPFCWHCGADMRGE